MNKLIALAFVLTGLASCSTEKTYYNICPSNNYWGGAPDKKCQTIIVCDFSDGIAKNCTDY